MSRWKRWVSSKRRLLTSLGAELPPGFDPELDSPVWGIRRFGEVINQSEQAADRLARAGVLDADQITLKPESEIA
jgi:hypothetical protein